MKVFHHLKEIPENCSDTAVAIGNFDGVHLGHQELLQEMLKQAKQNGLVPTVVTFYPHPVEVLRPNTLIQRLTTTAEKLTILENMGVEQVLVVGFDRHFSELSAESFFETYLVKSLKAKSIHVGFDFHFGVNRSGNTDTLKELARARSIPVSIQNPITIDGEKVSSSLIRKELVQGHIQRVNKLLGHPYFISGQVSPGDQRGRTIGFPTANLRCPKDKALPLLGVYITRVEWQKQSFPSVCNVGIRPTFVTPGGNKEMAPLVEVHILNFNAAIYDEFLRVEFLDFVRPEMKFSSLEDLKKQIFKDAETAANHFKK